MRRIIIKTTKIPIYKDIYTRIIYIIFLWSYAKKKTNEKLTNCKLLLCIWILNKKNKSKFNEQFQIFQHWFERGANPTTDLQEHRFALRLNAPLFVVSSLSLSLSSQRRQTTCGGGALSLSISLSLTSLLTNIKHVHAARALFIARSASLMIASLAIINIVNRYRHRHQAHQQC